MFGKLASAEDEMQATASQPGGATTSGERLAFTQGALARLAIAPKVAPFLAGRVGLGSENEAGISYTGRALRLDFRHAFEGKTFALSVGAGASGLLARGWDAPSEEMAPGGGLRSIEMKSASGYGADLPVLVGYRSDGDVVVLWAGLRAGIERSAYDLLLVVSPDVRAGSAAEATRLWGGGLFGFAIGLAPIQIALELDAAYESISGSLLTGEAEVTGDVAGLSLTPAAAISAKF